MLGVDHWGMLVCPTGRVAGQVRPPKPKLVDKVYWSANSVPVPIYKTPECLLISSCICKFPPLNVWSAELLLVEVLYWRSDLASMPLGPALFINTRPLEGYPLIEVVVVTLNFIKLLFPVMETPDTNHSNIK